MEKSDVKVRSIFMKAEEGKGWKREKEKVDEENEREKEPAITGKWKGIGKRVKGGE